jgi:hypothetical protein
VTTYLDRPMFNDKEFHAVTDNLKVCQVLFRIAFES